MRTVSCLLTSLALLIAEPAEAQMDAVIAGTVGAGLLEASGAVDEILDSAADRSNYVVFGAASQTRLLIEALRISALDILDESVSEFDNSQKQLFDNINAQIVKLQQGLGQTIEEARQTVEGVQGFVNDALPWMRESVVLRSQPSVLGPSTLQAIPFVFRGMKLDKARPTLRFGDVQATRIGLRRDEATFTVPAAAFAPQPDEPTFATGILEMRVKPCRVFCRRVVVRTEVPVLVLPAQLGTIQVFRTSRSLQNVEVGQYVDQATHSSGNITRDVCRTWTRQPSNPDHFIAVETLREDKWGARAWSVNRVNTNAAGFAYELCARAKISNGKKRNGEAGVRAYWKEYKRDYVTSPLTPVEAPGTLNWGTPINVVLPDDTHAITVVVTFFDGSSAMFDGVYEHKYLESSWNNATKQLILRSKTPTSIAGIN